MIPAIFRLLSSVVGKSVQRAAPVRAAIKRPSITSKAIPLKPNKIIRVGRVTAAKPVGAIPATKLPPQIQQRIHSNRQLPQSRAIAPVIPAQRIQVPTREYSGNTGPFDTSSALTYGKGRPQSSVTPNSPVSPGTTGGTDTAARLLAGASFLQGQLSSFIPSITWTGSISARGFKTTPLRTVLHYCLAAVFGVVHQARIGHTIIKVDLFPNENKVDIVFTNSSSLLLEAINVAGIVLAKNAESNIDSVEKLLRPIGEAIKEGNVGGAVFSYIEDRLNPLKAVNDFVDTVQTVSRLLGPAYIWDMAQRDFFAGKPPSTMIIGHMDIDDPTNIRPQPYGQMLKDTLVDNVPMLTRKLAFNPQAPPISKVTGGKMTHHFNLRSLVAQALYDPGVLPPPPDTNVALPNAKL